MFQQTTLSKPFTLSGIGVHTGASSRVTVRPAAGGRGIIFVCGAAAVPIPARAAFVVNTRRCTTLGVGDIRIDTVEHLLSALAGMEIDNVEIEVDGPELPILDGSALPWVEAIRAAGVVELPDPGQELLLTDPVALRDGESWIVAAPAAELSFLVVTDFDHPLLGTQAVNAASDAEWYAQEIAPARTFGFEHEVDALIAAGLARGGTLQNALIIHPDRFSSPLRMPQECARHKLLDLMGDLALVGCRLRAAITAIKPGHRINTAFAKALADEPGCGSP